MGFFRKHWAGLIGGFDLLFHVLRAFADFVGYVDTAMAHIPGQDHSWLARVYRTLLQPPGWLILVMIAVGLGLIYWDLRRNRKPIHPHAAPAPQPSAIIRADTWLQDAVAFALYGHWPAENETIFGGDGDIEKMGNVIEQMRGFAHAGELQIWGRQNQLSLHVVIKPDFWVNNVIALDTLWGPPDTPRTESLEFGAPPPFKALKVSRAQIEALFFSPPASHAQRVSNSPVASLSMIATRANQPLRDAARLAFETIQGNDSERTISGLNPTPEKRLGYFMADMAGQELRHYGKRPPSTVAMEIPLKELLRMHPVDGENALIEIFEQHPAYVDVTVNGDDLREYLDKLKTRYP